MWNSLFYDYIDKVWWYYFTLFNCDKNVEFVLWIIKMQNFFLWCDLLVFDVNFEWISFVQTGVWPNKKIFNIIVYERLKIRQTKINLRLKISFFNVGRIAAGQHNTGNIKNFKIRRKYLYNVVAYWIIFAKAVKIFLVFGTSTKILFSMAIIKAII